MAWLPTSYAYTHPDGWNDSVNFPTTPTSESQTRSLLQEQHTEALRFINDIALKLNNVPAVRVHGLSTQTIANNTPIKLTFASKIFDTDSIFDASTDNTKLICKTAGIYIITAYIYWGTESNVGYRDTQIFVNSTSIADNLITPTGYWAAFTMTSIYKLNVGDYVQVQVGQNSGIDMTIQSKDLMMVKIA